MAVEKKIKYKDQRLTKAQQKKAKPANPIRTKINKCDLSGMQKFPSQSKTPKDINPNIYPK